MKLLRCLFVMMLVCALSRVARADDFKLGVQDSPDTHNVYTGSPLTVSFSSCGYRDPNTDGCVTIKNGTDATLTSLTIDILANQATINDHGGGCATEAPGISCSYTLINLIDDGSEYQFIFTGLDIPADSVCNTGDTFTIEEEGVKYWKFPDATVSSVTPEPASFWLLSTGVLLFGGFLYRRRLGTGALGS
jgi:hypothetical protein